MRAKKRELWLQPNKQANKQDFDFDSTFYREILVSGMRKQRKNTQKKTAETARDNTKTSCFHVKERAVCNTRATGEGRQRLAPPITQEEMI